MSNLFAVSVKKHPSGSEYFAGGESWPRGGETVLISLVSRIDGKVSVANGAIVFEAGCTRDSDSGERLSTNFSNPLEHARDQDVCNPPYAVDLRYGGGGFTRFLGQLPSDRPRLVGWRAFWDLCHDQQVTVTPA